jgi:hypothetical protein
MSIYTWLWDSVVLEEHGGKEMWVESLFGCVSASRAAGIITASKRLLELSAPSTRSKVLSGSPTQGSRAGRLRLQFRNERDSRVWLDQNG